MSDPKSTLIVGADTEGVTTELKALVRDVDSLGQAVTKAGDSMSGFGVTTAEALKGADRQTKTLVNQIKTAALDIETAGKSLADKFELKGLAKGIDPKVLAPYIAALREAEAAQASQAASAVAAANKTKAALAEQTAFAERSRIAAKALAAEHAAVAAANQKVGATINSDVVPGLERMGMTAKATAAAMRSVPAQFTDIVVSLQGGQAPLTVLLQQGGQLKDMFGGIGNAARAMGTYLAGLINPLTLAATAVGVVGYAFYQGVTQAQDFTRAMIETGGASGQTALEMQATATAISKLSGASIGAASDAAIAIARSNGVASESYSRFGAIATAVQRETGVAVGDTVKIFEELGKKPLEASVKLNESMRYLTLEAYQQIKALADLGKTAEAGALAQEIYASAQATRTADLARDLNLLERAWRATGSAAKAAWADFAGIFTPADPTVALQAALAKAKEKLADNIGNQYTPQLARAERPQLEAAVAAAQKALDLKLKTNESAAAATAEQVKQNGLVAAQREFDAAHDKYLTDAVKKERELTAAKERYVNVRQTPENAKKYADEIAAIEKAYKPKGGSSAPRRDRAEEFRGEQDAAKEWAKAMLEADKISDQARGKIDELSKGQLAYRTYLESTAAAINDKVNPAMGELLKRKFEVAIEDEKAAALAKEQAKYLEGIAKANEAEVKSLDAKITAQQLYNATVGLSAEQIAKYKQTQEEATTAELEGKAEAIDALLERNRLLEEAGDLLGLLPKAAKDAYEAEKKGLDEVIARRKKLSAEYGVGAERSAEVASAKAAAAEWKRGWEETDRLARDVFTTWATDGSNAAKKIGDTLKKALLSAIYEATLKPVVLQLYTSIAGNGGASSALQAASGGGNAVSGLGSLFSAGGAISNGISSIGASLMNGPFSSLVGDLGASLVSNSAAIAGAVPYVGAALLAVKALTEYKIEARGSGLTATIGGASGLPSGSVGQFREFSQTSSGILSGGNTINRDWSVADQGVATYIAKSVQAITASNKAYAAALGLTSGSVDDFTKSIEVNIDGLDAAGQQAAINAELNKFAAEQAASAFGSATAAFAKEGETTAQTLQRLGGDVSSANAIFKQMGYALFEVSAAGASAASTLIAAFGGVSEAASQIGSFQQNYFTEAEQQTSAYGNAQAALASAGLNYTVDQLRAATRDEIRAAVDQLAGLANTDQGAAQYAAAVRAANAISGLKTATSTPNSSAQAGGGFTPFSAEWYANGGAGGSSGSDALLPSSSGGSAAVDSNVEAARSLQEQLDQLTLSALELQKRQLAAQRELLNESNKLLFDQVQAAKLAATNREYQDRINVLTGVTTDRALSLQRDLAAATDTSTQSLIQMVYALEDMQTASESAIAAAKESYSNAQGSTDKAYAALERSVAAQKAIAQETITNAKAVIDAVSGAVKSLFGKVDSVVQSEAAKGVAFIDNALSVAQTTGYLPDPKALGDAIGQATGGIDGQQFTSQADADFARLVLAGKLNALGDLAEPQLTAAELAVKALDEALVTAREQIDQLRGIDNSVKSVEEAIKLLASALLAERAAKAASLIPTGGTIPLNPIGNIYAGMGGDVKTIQDLYSVNLGREADAAGAAYWSAQFLGDGVIDAAERQAFAIASLDEYRAKTRTGLAVGTNYVPYDGFEATLHEGEAVIPKAYNPMAGGSANGRLEELVEKLIAKVAALEAPMKDAATAATEHKDLFSSVTENGNGMRTEVMRPIPTT